MTPNRWVAVAAGFVFAIGCIVATSTPGPLLTIDDVANFGLAHALAGQGPAPMDAQAPYGPLYPALIAPGWLVGLDEGGMLAWARGVNALAGALLVPVLYALVRRLTGVDWWPALAASVAAAMLPAGMLTASIVWSERLLWLLVAAAALAMVATVQLRTPRSAAIAVLTAIGLSAGHPRLGAAAVVVLAVTAGSLRRSGRGAVGAVAAVGAVGLWGVEMARSAMAEAAFGSSGTYDVGDLAGRRGFDELIPAAPQHALGALTYLLLAGTLVAAWGLVLLLRSRQGWPILAMGVAVLAVAAWFLTGVPRADRWLHGRYVEVMAPILFALGLATLDRVRVRVALVLGFVLPVLGGVVAAWNGPGNTWASPRSPVMMLGVEVSGAPYGGAVFEPGAAASVAIVVGFVLWASARRWGPGPAAGIALLVIMWAVDSGDTTLDRLYATTPAAEVAAVFPDDESIGEVFLDTSAVSPNLTNAFAWEAGFGRSVIEPSSTTTHHLLGAEFAPPAGSVAVVEFSGATLWRLP